jgi:Fe(3+) dicitrate transport protein
MQRCILAAAMAAALNTAVQANNENLEEVTIIGSREAAQNLAGSGSVVDFEQIQIESANDINQLLKTVPGIYILEEDGYGLRPNIGIRAATSERSSKITLMEDGVLIAPAPYSNPAAYYFPTAMRMHSIEVLKGAPLLRYGPQTTGGVINMVSTPIPDENTGAVNFAYGENAEVDTLANYGGRAGAFGYLVETAQRRSDGFKDIDRSGSDTGYDIEDYLVKLSWEGARQSLLFKGQYSQETSDETYLGLTDDDFNRDEDRRYGLSEPDEMDNDHHGYNLVYRREFSDSIDMSVTGYYNEFSRNWFKLNGGGKFVDAANAGDDFARGVLDGSQDIEGLEYKHNNRDYESKGVELNFDMAFGKHQLALGGRVHRDEMDRFQRRDYYDQVDGELFYVSTTWPCATRTWSPSVKSGPIRSVPSWAAAVTMTTTNCCPGHPSPMTWATAGSCWPACTRVFLPWVAAPGKTRTRRPVPIGRRVSAIAAAGLWRPSVSTAISITRLKIAPMPAPVATALPRGPSTPARQRSTVWKCRREASCSSLTSWCRWT